VALLLGRSGSEAALDSLPWRGPGAGRPGLPLPPAGRMPLLWSRRLRKQWRYVGVFTDEFMLCAARVRLGPVGQTFWAVLDRRRGELIERTQMRSPGRRGEVWSETGGGQPWPIGSDAPGVVTRIGSDQARATLRIGEGRWAESVCPNGEGGYVWTRKRVAPIDCEVELADGRRWSTTARGIEDESAGYHRRHTVWWWSAGIGEAGDGRAVGWNLVSGVNDPPERSERAIWVDGEPSEPTPVQFDGLDGIDFADGSRLDFAAEAERRAEENKLIFRFSYRQPFGTFTGSLPGIDLAHGVGVMEHHDAVW
jgi:hypothetical protein